MNRAPYEEAVACSTRVAAMMKKSGGFQAIADREKARELVTTLSFLSGRATGSADTLGLTPEQVELDHEKALAAHEATATATLATEVDTCVKALGAGK